MRDELVRYALCMALVVACGTGLVLAMVRATPEPEAAAEVDAAVMIDLPPAASSSQPASGAAPGPDQQAAQGAPPRQPADTIEPPKPVEEPKPAAREQPSEPSPRVPNSPAVLEREPQPVTPPPTPVTAAPTPVQDAHAPPGSEMPVETGADDDQEGRPPPSAHAITSWQKALMKRLEMARRTAGDEPHAAGTVKIAFEIDASGGLASERVARSSGSATLDRAALLLVRRAAPFPAPPGHAASRDTSFVVPVRFR